MNRDRTKEIFDLFGQQLPERDKLFQRIIDALMDEDISPELRAEMQQHVRYHATEQQLEEAFARYAPKVEPESFGGKLEGDNLVSYNKLAERLGLAQYPDTKPDNISVTEIS